MKFILDAGHALIGATGASGNGYKEEIEARKIVSSLEQKLKKLGHKVIIASCDNEKDSNKQLQKIVTIANAHKDADLFISIHFNAFSNPSANGTETYSYNKYGTGHTYATKVHNELVKLGFTDRKKKEAGFYVLRHTTCPAILVETAFITNADDMKKYNVDKVSEAILKAITGQSSKGFNETLYRVVAGTYSDRRNAETQIKKLSSLGIDARIDIYKKG